jgi:hypothetical protein
MGLMFECTEPNCTVATTGKCIDGLKPEDCTRAEAVAASYRTGTVSVSGGVVSTKAVADGPAAGQSSDEAPPSVDAPPSEWVDLHSAEEMKLPDMKPRHRDTFPRVVVLFGAPESGKTTTIAALHRAHLMGATPWRFRSSRTLMALERYCFFNRFASGRSHSATERTQATASPGFAHFDVERVDGRLATLYITNFSGEAVLPAQWSVDVVNELPGLDISTHAALLIDSERLASSEYHWDEANRAKRFVQAILDSKMPARTQFTIVLSKADAFLAQNVEDWTKQRALELASDLSTQCQKRFRQATWLEMAARPTHGPVSEPSGLLELVGRWVDDVVPLGVPS